MKILTNDFIIKLIDVVYKTVQEAQTKDYPRDYSQSKPFFKQFKNEDEFKKIKLEDYDEWKDIIVKRVIDLILKEL